MIATFLHNWDRAACYYARMLEIGWKKWQMLRERRRWWPVIKKREELVATAEQRSIKRRARD